MPNAPKILFSLLGRGGVGWRMGGGRVENGGVRRGVREGLGVCD